MSQAAFSSITPARVRAQARRGLKPRFAGEVAGPTVGGRHSPPTDSFIEKAQAYRPLVPGDMAREAAEILDALIGDGQHCTAHVDDGRYPQDMVIISIVMTTAQFDRLAAWGAAWSELEEVDSDLSGEEQQEGEECADAGRGIPEDRLCYAEDANAIPEPSATGSYTKLRPTFHDFDDAEEGDPPEDGHDQEGIDEREDGRWFWPGSSFDRHHAPIVPDEVLP